MITPLNTCGHSLSKNFRQTFLNSLGVAVLLLSASCSPAPDAMQAAPDAEQEAAATEIGKHVTDELMTTLGGRLKVAVQEGGPVAGIDVCSGLAMDITQKVAEDNAVVGLKRVGVRARNPANTPEALDLEAFAYFIDQKQATGEWPAQWIAPVEGDIVTYYRPIVLQAQCLVCHGPADKIPATVKGALATSYPHDEATGFQEGELRGAFAVKLKLPGK